MVYSSGTDHHTADRVGWSSPKALIGRAWRRARRTAAAGVKLRPLCRGECSRPSGVNVVSNNNYNCNNRLLVQVWD